MQASTGIRLTLNEKIDILPGMPFISYENNKKEIKEIFKKEITENIKTGKKGIIAKADSLGSLEALLVLLKQSNIPVLKAGIGNINKSDIISAKANLEIDKMDAIILGFNTSINEDAKDILSKNSSIKFISDNVVYKLIENLIEFRRERRREIEKKKLMELTTLCKLKILHEYVFRNTKPAIFGVKIKAGKLISHQFLISEDNEKIGKTKSMQADKNSVPEATQGMEVALSMQGVNFDKQVKNKKFLYSNISEKQFRTFKKHKDLLNQNEIKILSEIADIKRKEKVDWGR
ncbi:MAG: hypothetical protein P8X70_03085 [Nanoarchaeota archaeon]